ncbi:hypothetical protein Tco_1145059 [Tanacetum coccineum]
MNLFTMCGLLSAEEAWETIENLPQGQKEWDKPFKAIIEQELASLRAQANELFGNEKVWFEMPRSEEPIGIPMEVEPFVKTQLKDLGLNTCNHEISLSSSIWEALEGNTLDLNSIWEETRRDYNFKRSGFKDACTMPGDGVAFPSDAVRTYKRQR